MSGYIKWGTSFEQQVADRANRELQEKMKANQSEDSPFMEFFSLIFFFVSLGCILYAGLHG